MRLNIEVRKKIILSIEALKWGPLDILGKIKRHQEEFQTLPDAFIILLFINS